MPEILGPEVSYCDWLDVEIAAKIKADDDLRRAGGGSHPLRPSSAGFCARRLAYELMEYRGHAFYERPPLTPEVYRLFKLGHAIEKQAFQEFYLIKELQQRFKQQIVTFFELPRATEDLPKEICEGSVDGVFWSEKFKAVCDIKSKKDKFSFAFKSGWEEELNNFRNMESLVQISDVGFYADDLDAFLEELNGDFLCDNIHQLNLYALSDFIKSRGIDHAFLYRYCKNDSRHHEIRFRPSPKAFRYVQEKFSAINVAVDKKDPESIEKEYFLGSMRCAFCPFKAQCWDEDALKSFFSKLPKKAYPKNVTNLMRRDEATKLFGHYEELKGNVEKLKAVERGLCEILHKEKVNRIKAPSGKIYELKFLKTPYEHYELRETKL